MRRSLTSVLILLVVATSAWGVHSAFASSFGPQASSFQPYDVVIQGGTIVDGTGNPGYAADLAIRDGRIARIGWIGAQASAGAQVIDARGKVVAPGFIDIHSHAENSLLSDGAAWSTVTQGVTTVVVGERNSVVPQTETWVENRRQRGQPYWTTVAEYFQALEEEGISVNVGVKVAPQQVKQVVFGTDNFQVIEERRADPDELEAMRNHIRQAIRDGAFGISSWFRGGGYPFQDELLEMARVTREEGGVIYETHVGSEGFQIMEELANAIEVAEVTGLPVQVAHFKIRGPANWDRMDEAIQMIEDARARGLDVTANQYPYTAMWQGWVNFFPGWSIVDDDLHVLLQDPDTRTRIRNDRQFQQFLEEHGGVEGVVLLTSEPSLLRYDGMRVVEIAEARGDEDPLETLFDLVVEHSGPPGGLHHTMSEENVRKIMALPWVAISSDAGSVRRPERPEDRRTIHPRHYGTFPRVLGRYVREEGILTLEDAVRKMSSLPAQSLRMQDRGSLREGYWADVVVFDPETVIDRATFEEPHEYAEGIEHVFVNGEAVLKEGRHTDARPGVGLAGPARNGNQTAANGW